MPRPLPPEQQEALEARGVVIPGAAREALPAETVARVLGSVGLPHSERVERLDERGDTEFEGSLDSLNAPALVESYRSTYGTVSDIMALVGESLPNTADRNLGLQLEKLKPAFEVFERHNLKPEVVLTPTHRSLDFWENLVQTVQGSSLNPEGPLGRKVLRGDGHGFNNTIREEWDILTNPGYQSPAWQLSVSSALNHLKISKVTSHGYIDEKNQLPNNYLNTLLRDLGQPVIPVRASHQLSQSLTQPDIHPTADTYVIQQLTSIIQRKKPLGVEIFYWIKGITAGGEVPIAVWEQESGQIVFGRDGQNKLYGDTGIRPSVRADHA